MHVHHALCTREIRAPNTFEEPFTGPGHARMLRHGAEKVELQFGELDPHTGQVNLPSTDINGKIALCNGVMHADAAQQGADAGGDFTRTERLDHVIVYTAVQAQQFIVLFASSCEHQEGQAHPGGAGTAGKLNACHAGQHPVEHRKVCAGQERPGFRTGLRFEDGVPFGAEIHAQNLQDSGVIIDDQNGGHSQPSGWQDGRATW
ncbi:hypothetical protein ASF71_16165 [Deinococcus sp. Leaf326]|nr:hypothetical protein ASF71_16165 [Deinococcus sp. Leaf326]